MKLRKRIDSIFVHMRDYMINYICTSMKSYNFDKSDIYTTIDTIMDIFWLKKRIFRVEYPNLLPEKHKRSTSFWNVFRVRFRSIGTHFHKDMFAYPITHPSQFT